MGKFSILYFSVTSITNSYALKDTGKKLVDRVFSRITISLAVNATPHCIVRKFIQSVDAINRDV